MILVGVGGTEGLRELPAPAPEIGLPELVARGASKPSAKKASAVERV